LARNKDRLGLGKEVESNDPVASPSPFSSDGPLIFETPSEFVELPTKGRFYSENHPLHNQDHIEIKHMTAREEDILSSKALLKRGVALDRFVQSVVKDKRIKVENLYIGDRNAILIAARITGYGEEYATQVTCPSCMSVERHSFDLEQRTLTEGTIDEDSGAEFTENGTIVTRLPVFKVSVELRLLTVKEENYLSRLMNGKKDKNAPESKLTDMLKMIIVSVEGKDDANTIASLVDHLPARDSKHLRDVYAKAVPNVNMKQGFECSSCSYEGEGEVPLNAEFVWPK
jgi:hypothetical protein